jgi:predicted phosphoadenosine phosphosulfate sulfurtransferase
MYNPKKYLSINVLEAARQRIAYTFDNFERICISFSGGKDSTVMLHLVMEEAIRRNQKIGLLFIDWEVQYTLTIEHIKECFELYKEYIDPYWVALPLLTTNSCSQFEPEWICWEPQKRHLWPREFPENSINDYSYFPFYYYPITFEEFVPEFTKWYAQGKLTACFVGIRTQESLNRFRAVANDKKELFDNKCYTTKVFEDDKVYNIYPIYDWKATDDWTYTTKFKKCYNKIYDLMYYAGLTVNQMRICEPYGDEQKRGLWLLHLLEPKLWAKAVARVAGANNGAMYANESGMVMGNSHFKKPDGHTWKSFAMMLLETMPEKTSVHYKTKIAVWHHWYTNKGIEIVDELPKDTGGDDKPTWRRVCKCILKNDYWCKTLGFGPNKASHYDKYIDLIRRKREEWKEI